jgi:hypothetical protein
MSTNNQWQRVLTLNLYTGSQYDKGISEQKLMLLILFHHKIMSM